MKQAVLLFFLAFSACDFCQVNIEDPESLLTEEDKTWVKSEIRASGKIVRRFFEIKKPQRQIDILIRNSDYPWGGHFDAKSDRLNLNILKIEERNQGLILHELVHLHESRVVGSYCTPEVCSLFMSEGLALLLQTLTFGDIYDRSRLNDQLVYRSFEQMATDDFLLFGGITSVPTNYRHFIPELYSAYILSELAHIYLYEAFGQEKMAELFYSRGDYESIFGLTLQQIETNTLIQFELEHLLTNEISL